MYLGVSVFGMATWDITTSAIEQLQVIHFLICINSTKYYIYFEWKLFIWFTHILTTVVTNRLRLSVLYSNLEYAEVTWGLKKCSASFLFLSIFLSFFISFFVLPCFHWLYFFLSYHFHKLFYFLPFFDSLLPSFFTASSISKFQLVENWNDANITLKVCGW